MTQSLSAEEIAKSEKLRSEYVCLVLTSTEISPEASRCARVYRSNLDAALPALLAMASRLVELEPHIEHGRKLLLEIGGGSEESWAQSDRTYENAAPLADALARVVGYPEFDEETLEYGYPTSQAKGG